MNEKDVISKLSKEELNRFLVEMNKALFSNPDPYGPGFHTAKCPPIDIAFRKEFTKEDILNFIEMQDYLLYDYILYGTKKTIELVRDQVPENCKICELPEKVMLDGLEDRLFLIKNAPLHKQYELWRNKNGYT